MATIDELREEMAARVPRRESGSPLPSLLAIGLGGLAGGALVYLFDPDRGRARRAQARDRIGALVRHGTREAERVGRAASAQAYGISQKVTHLRPEQGEPLDDASLQQKVETELFRDPGIPKGQININAERGVIVLRGQLESPEQIADVESRVRRIAGVWDVQNLLHLPGLPAGTGA